MFLILNEGNAKRLSFSAGLGAAFGNLFAGFSPPYSSPVALAHHFTTSSVSCLKYHRSAGPHGLCPAPDIYFIVPPNLLNQLFCSAVPPFPSSLTTLLFVSLYLPTSLFQPSYTPIFIFAVPPSRRSSVVHAC